MTCQEVGLDLYSVKKFPFFPDLDAKALFFIYISTEGTAECQFISVSKF